MDERKRGGEAEQNSSLRAGGDVQTKGASRNYLSAWLNGRNPEEEATDADRHMEESLHVLPK